jgi:hypothetical protein
MGSPPFNAMQPHKPANRQFGGLGTLTFDRRHDRGPLRGREDVCHRLGDAESRLRRFDQGVQARCQGLPDTAAQEGRDGVSYLAGDFNFGALEDEVVGKALQSSGLPMRDRAML